MKRKENGSDEKAAGFCGNDDGNVYALLSYVHGFSDARSGLFSVSKILLRSIGCSSSNAFDRETSSESPGYYL